MSFKLNDFYGSKEEHFLFGSTAQKRSVLCQILSQFNAVNFFNEREKRTNKKKQAMQPRPRNGLIWIIARELKLVCRSHEVHSMNKADRKSQMIIGFAFNQYKRNSLAAKEKKML